MKELRPIEDARQFLVPQQRSEPVRGFTGKIVEFFRKIFEKLGLRKSVLYNQASISQTYTDVKRKITQYANSQPDIEWLDNIEQIKNNLSLAEKILENSKKLQYEDAAFLYSTFSSSLEYVRRSIVVTNTDDNSCNEEVVQIVDSIIVPALERIHLAVRRLVKDKKQCNHDGFKSWSKKFVKSGIKFEEDVQGEDEPFDVDSLDLGSKDSLVESIMTTAMLGMLDIRNAQFVRDMKNAQHMLLDTDFHSTQEGLNAREEILLSKGRLVSSIVEILDNNDVKSAPNFAFIALKVLDLFVFTEQHNDFQNLSESNMVVFLQENLKGIVNEVLIEWAGFTDKVFLDENNILTTPERHGKSLDIDALFRKKSTLVDRMSFYLQNKVFQAFGDNSVDSSYTRWKLKFDCRSVVSDSEWDRCRCEPKERVVVKAPESETEV